MSPAGRLEEQVTNKMLSGTELKKIILADFEKLLDNHGLLSAHIAYGRVGYTIYLKFSVDNVGRPEMDTRVDSTPRRNLDGTLLATEAPPLSNPSENAAVLATKLERSIDNPNAERIRNGIPITVTRKQADGTIVQKEIKYPASAAEEAGPGDIKTTEIDDAVEQDWNSTP